MPLKTIALLLVGTVLLYAMFTVGFPFLLALIIAILLEPAVLWLMKTLRLNRMAASVAACTACVISLLAAFYFIGLKAYFELQEFWNKIPQLLNDVDLYIQSALTGREDMFQMFPKEWAGYIQQGLTVSVDSLTDALKSLIAAVSGLFLDVARTIPNLFVFVIVFIVALYMFSFGLNQLKRASLGLFAKESVAKVESVLDHLKKAIIGFIRAQFLISLLTYLITLLGLLLLGTPYPLAVALLIMIVDLLPVLGTGSVLVPWAIYNLIVGDIHTAIGLTLLFVLITVFRRIVEPKILGDAVGISALAALVSLYVGFKLVGVAGIFLGPVIVIFYQALKQAGLIRIQIKL